ncbi:AsmA family protein [Sphingomonas flavalba]|uniref:AsmA family protein n=1 Tax=Sphingomonas flavalba TaxID=2559804 RepID=UPI00109DE6E4|nr:AsmA family protein [Sphingomonas flavalba]
MTKQRTIVLIAAGVALLAAGMVVAAALTPIGWLRPTVEQRLAATIGAPVRIGSLGRLDHFSLSPRISVRGLVVAQPAWAGRGDLARIDSLVVRLPLWPLLSGRVAPREIAVDGAALALVRDATGRENWRREKKPDRASQPIALSAITIRNARISYTDAKRDRRFDARATFDRAGFRLTGTGAVLGQPVTLSATGVAIAAGAKPGRWPFVAVINGKALAMRAEGAMDRPFDLDHFTARVTARGDDLKLLDAIIEAGLPGTQPVTLVADVRHDAPDWKVNKLRGTMGRSDFTGAVTVAKRDGRSIVTGALDAGRFDFDDLANARGRAIARAKLRQSGPRLIPDTAIDLKRMQKTDGEIRFTARRLLWRTPTPFTAMRGTLRLDHGLLTVDPLELALPRGRLRGKATVDQRGGAAVPLLTLDLTLNGAALASFSGDSDLSGRFDARAKLAGRGVTVREALGRATGTVGLAARDGVLPARLAAFIGFDVGHGLLAKKDDTAGLRCLAMRLAVRDGVGRIDPLIIDTTRSQARATGTINLASERLNAQLTGAPKGKALLRYDAPLPVGGTIKAPELTLPSKSERPRQLLKMLGRALSGKKQTPRAEDADCNALIARALAG